MSAGMMKCTCLTLPSLCLVYYLLLSPLAVDSANILGIFPTASYSHQMPQLSLARALARKGHNVTVITPNPSPTPISNYTEIDISFTYKFWKSQGNSENETVINLQGKLTPMEILTMFTTGILKLTAKTLASPKVQSFINYLDEEKPKFDLVLYEDLLQPAFLGFLHKVGHPPLITIMTLPLFCGMDMSSGNDCNPSYVPDVVFGTHNKMNFWERIHHTVAVTYSKLIVKPGVFKNNDLIARKYFGSDCPPLESMLQNRSLHLSTSSWIFEYPRPVFPNTIHVGPLHIDDTMRKPLSQDLTKWIQGAKKGFIYFSFGSNFKSTSMDKHTRSAILAAFARLPEFRIIWKWEDEKMEGLPKNVLCLKWLPQQDLIADPNIKLFITQGGLQSFQEAVHSAVPMIGVPIFGDQNYNVRIIERIGIGSYLEYEDITEETLFKHMHEILYNDKYKKAAQRASAISRTQILSPMETAIWWVEYVLKFGGNTDHLRPDYYHLSWYQYWCIDVVLVILTAIVLFFYGIYYLASSMLRRKLSKRKTKKE